jgi:hypothetical protein
VCQGNAHDFGWFAGSAKPLLEGDEVRLVTAHHAGCNEQDFGAAGNALDDAEGLIELAHSGQAWISAAMASGLFWRAAAPCCPMRASRDADAISTPQKIRGTVACLVCAAEMSCDCSVARDLGSGP